MWKAYGLALQAAPERHPGALGDQGDEDGDDATSTSRVSSVKDKRTGTALGAWDYRGGPFIVDSAVRRAGAADHHRLVGGERQPAERPRGAGRLQRRTSTSTLRSAPRIANEAINAGITIAYYNAAGIPDSNGNPWSTHLAEHPRRDGDRGRRAVRPGHDLPAAQVRHLRHAAQQRLRLLADRPDEPRHEDVLRSSTRSSQDGGGWTALCHSILEQREQHLRPDAERQRRPSRTCSRRRLPGGIPGGFLTTNGFSTIDNTGGTWTINPSRPTCRSPSRCRRADAAGAARRLGADVAVAGQPGRADLLRRHRARRRTSTRPAVDHDNIIAGTYHNGTGAGKLTYIGGHSFSTSLPYSTNAEAPYLRAFYNSLFFNGGAVAKLDLTLVAGELPAERHRPAQREHRQHRRAATRPSVRNVGLTLRPASPTSRRPSGPAPTVSGQTLRWPGGLGDIAGGATAVTFKVSVASSVSGTSGSKQFGTFHAPYGDEFGEALHRRRLPRHHDHARAGADAHEDAGVAGARSPPARP